MRKKDNKIIADLIIGIAVSGLFFLLIGMVWVSDKWLYARSLMIGMLGAAGMVIHMYYSLNKALDMEPARAENHVRISYLQRTAVLSLLFAAGVYFKIVTVVPCFLGVMTLKTSAYLQPYINKWIVNRLSKTKD